MSVARRGHVATARCLKLLSHTAAAADASAARLVIGSSRALCASAGADPTNPRRAARERKRRGERSDSVDEAMLADRAAHAAAVAAAWPEDATLSHIRALKLGRPAGWHNQGLAKQRRSAIAQTLGAEAALLGKTGVGMHTDWSRLNRGALPEVAIMGHANCGKSSLLNALSGSLTRKGPAKVSSRAGWTAELSFYRLLPHRSRQRLRAQKAAALATEQLAEQAEEQGNDSASMASQSAHSIRVNHGESGLVLVDTPGYGFTVGSSEQLNAWGRLIADYLDHSPRLRLTLLLVDATRGLCAADVRVLGRLRLARVPTLVALTKADLLDAQDLAGSHAVVAAQLEQMATAFDAATGSSTATSELPPLPSIRTRPHPLILSSNFFAGVNHLWRSMLHELEHLTHERRTVMRPPVHTPGTDHD